MKCRARPRRTHLEVWRGVLLTAIAPFRACNRVDRARDIVAQLDQPRHRGWFHQGVRYHQPSMSSWFATIALLIAVACGAPARAPHNTTNDRAAPLSLAGVTLSVPSECSFERADRGGKIACPHAVLDWLTDTGNAVDEIEAQLVAAGARVVARMAVDCRLGAIDGNAMIFTVEHEGANVSVFACAIPWQGRYAVARCLGYDPRRGRRDEPPVPAPCDQVVVWQPVLTAP